MRLQCIRPRRSPLVPVLVLTMTLATLAAPAPWAAAQRQPRGPGCDPTRPATAHYGGAIPAPGARASAPVPCAAFVGPANESALVGVSSASSVFYAPLIGEPMPGVDGWSPPCPTNELVARSDDLGATWTQLDPAGPRSSGCVPAWMSVDPDTSRIWFPTTPVHGPTPADVCGARITWSDDDGDHWATGGDVPCPSQGAEKLLEGPPPASGPEPVGYPHVVYYCANDADGATYQHLWCYRSLDGGQTFAFTGGFSEPALPPGGCAAWPDGIPTSPPVRTRAGIAGPDGVLYFPVLVCGTLGVAISRDEGASWEFRAGIAASVDDLYTTGSAVDRHGNLFFAYRGPGGLAYLVSSADHGASWSAPAMVAPPGVQGVRRVAVTARGNGEVALAYLGTTDGAHFNGYITQSQNVFAAHPLFWSASVNAPSQPLINAADPETFWDRFFYLSVAIGPDGTPWAGFHCAKTDACPDQRIGVVGRLTKPAGG
jgi:hypothetical protein